MEEDQTKSINKSYIKITIICIVIAFILFFIYTFLYSSIKPLLFFIVTSILIFVGTYIFNVLKKNYIQKPLDYCFDRLKDTGLSEDFTNKIKEASLDEIKNMNLDEKTITSIFDKMKN